MSNEVTTTDEQPPARADRFYRESSDAAPIISQIMALASNPAVNPEMFDRLVAWQEREQAAQAEEAFNAAMNLAQAEIEPVARTAENTQTKSFYAKLEAVDHAIRPIYLKHGFNVAYGTVPPLTPGNIRVECEVSLGRHSKRYYREAPADTLGPKGTAIKTVLHGGGSTETFLKRYAVCGAFNVVFKNQDDDGVRGGQQFITDEQIAVLQAKCTEAGREESYIVGRLFADLHHFNEIPAGGFEPTLNTLEGIIHQNKQRAAKGSS